MKNATRTTARATRAKAQSAVIRDAETAYSTERSRIRSIRSFAGARPTLAPRPEDVPEETDVGVSLAVSVSAALDHYDGERRGNITWHGRLERELDPTCEDRSEGVVVHLSAVRTCWSDIPGQTHESFESRVDLTKVFGILTPAEFRRLVAALNTLAASLPSWPEPQTASTATSVLER